MVFKSGVALMALAASAAVATADPVKIHTGLQHPIVKDVSVDNGKLRLVLAEGTTVEKKSHSKKHTAPKYAHAKTAEHEKETSVKKLDSKKPFGVKVVAPKHPEPKKHSEKKHAATSHKHKAEPTHKHKTQHHKQVSEEKKPSGEIVRKYAHGQVTVQAKNQPAQTSHKKHATTAVKKPVKQDETTDVDVLVDDDSSYDEEWSTDGSSDEDFDIGVGESVSLIFGEHWLELELLKNGSLALYADDEYYLLPPSDSIDIDVDDYDDDSGTDDSNAEDEAVEATATTSDDESIAKKFTELATKMTGNGRFFSKDAAPVIFVGGVIGALAAIVGIAAIAVNRRQSAAAAEDPQSVLADATEDADPEAGVTTEESESAEDAAAEDSQSLSGSDSESDADEDQEEGKFTNEVASV